SACADCTSLVMLVMPLLAAWMVLMPLDMESNKLLRVLARVSRPCAVKKLMALSRAELTFLTVANRFCVWVIKFVVCCNCSRFERTPLESTISLMASSLPFQGQIACRG